MFKSNKFVQYRFVYANFFKFNSNSQESRSAVIYEIANFLNF